MGKANKVEVPTTEQVVPETTEQIVPTQDVDDNAPLETVSDAELNEALNAFLSISELETSAPEIKVLSTTEKPVKAKKERVPSTGRVPKATYTKRGFTSEDTHEFDRIDFMDDEWKYKLPDANKGVPGKDGTIRGYGYNYQGTNIIFFQNSDARAFADFLSTGVKPKKFSYIGPVEIARLDGATAKEAWKALTDEQKAKIAVRK